MTTPDKALAPSWIRDLGSLATGVELSILVVPKASRSRVAGEHGVYLRIQLAAPAVEGRANEALLEFLASTLAVKKRAVRLVAGQTSRRKRVQIDGVSIDRAVKLLGSDETTKDA